MCVCHIYTLIDRGCCCGNITPTKATNFVRDVIALKDELEAALAFSYGNLSVLWGKFNKIIDTAPGGMLMMKGVYDMLIELEDKLQKLR